eukprot:TRINITY_DN3013_c0_g1_i1.p1 TRINITY_DN3013_c0_g1~~TRINITY_DN3013_c0_g1_i1.p1  ORF type:complete len:482 (+),score=159.95 TRINITY_DN3013_c0_g1_i1:54-1499(+)
MRHIISLTIFWAIAIIFAEKSPLFSDKPAGDEPQQALEKQSIRLPEFLKLKDANKDQNIVRIEQFIPKKPGPVNQYRMILEQDVKEGSPIYSYPLENSLTVHTALQDPLMGPTFHELSRVIHGKTNVRSEAEDDQPEMLFDDQIVKLYLIYLRSQPNSEWAPYLEAIPDFEVPVFWSDAELAEIKGSRLYSSTIQTKNALADEYRRMFPRLTERFPEQFPADVFTLADYTWAHALYISRNWYKDVNKPIFPVTEVFNYRGEQNVKIIEEDGRLTLVAMSDLKSGDVVIVRESQLTNRQLLEFFGFVLEKGGDTTIDVAVGLDPAEQLYNPKRLKLKERGISEDSQFSLRTTEIPEDLLYALRIFHSTTYDWDDITNADRNKPVSLQSEKLVAQSLIDTCQSAFSEYMTTAREDKNILAGNPSHRLKQAVLLRRAEKKVLWKTLEIGKKVMKQVLAQWDMRTYDLPTANEQGAAKEEFDEYL